MVTRRCPTIGIVTGPNEDDRRHRRRRPVRVSEYVRELIRQDQNLQRLRGLLLEGAASPPVVTLMRTTSAAFAITSAQPDSGVGKTSIRSVLHKWSRAN